MQFVPEFIAPIFDYRERHSRRDVCSEKERTMSFKQRRSHPPPGRLIIPLVPHPKLFKPRVRVVDVPPDPVLGYNGRDHRVALGAEVFQCGSAERSGPGWVAGMAMGMVLVDAHGARRGEEQGAGE
jgi:hypothetical protein